MRNIYLIARRDYLGYVTAWGFWLGLLLTPIIIGASMIVPQMIRENQPTRYFTVLDPAGELTAAIQSELEGDRVQDVQTQFVRLEREEAPGFDPESTARFQSALVSGASLEDAVADANAGLNISIPDRDFIYVPPPAQTQEELLPYLLGEKALPDMGEQTLFAAIIVSEDGQEITYLSSDVVNSALRRVVDRASTRLTTIGYLSTRNVDLAEFLTVVENAPEAVPLRAREGGETGAVTNADKAPYLAAVLVTFVLWLLVFSVVQYLLSGTIEERSNKIFDTLLTSARLPQLLAGKLLAVLALALTLMTAWGIGGFLISKVLGGGLPADITQFIGAMGASVFSPGMIIPTLISFLLGYLIFGALFLALGSLCETVQESQTLISPILILLMVPLFMLAMAVEDPTSPFLRAMSWFPLFTPFLLILRLPAGLPLWEITGQIALMAATAGIILWASMKVYRAGAVHGAGVDSVGKWIKGMMPGGKAKTEA